MNNEVILYKDGELELPVEVAPDKETVWLKGEEMAKLFDRDRSVIQRHIKIYLRKMNWKKAQLVQNLHKFKMKVTGLSKELLITTILIWLSLLDIE